jgi:hypothetical protein
MIEMSTNISDVIAGFDKIEGRIKAQITERVRSAVEFIDSKVHERTPVWSGRAVRNMIWTMESPNQTEFEPIASPAEFSEARRSANTEAARETMKALRFDDPFHSFILSNNAAHIGLIEDGSAPTPERSRSPNGVFAITVADVMARLSSGAAT